MNSVFIFTEGGKNIGLGHVRRCLVIAHELAKKEIDVFFYVNRDSSAIAWIKKESFPYKIISLDRPWLLNTAVPHKGLIVIDTKKQVSRLVRSLKKAGHTIVLLDNITDARQEADCVIYPTAIYENDMDREKFKGTVFGGSKYVPIARSFIEMRGKTIDKKLQPPYRILITMGGSDPNHLTGRIVSALRKSYLPINIKVVLGPAFPPDPQLDDLERQNVRTVEFIRDRDDLSSVMADSDIAITALGTTIFELACLGIPSILVANYKTDEADMFAFKKLGIGLPLGYHEDVSDSEIQNGAEAILSNKAVWENMSRKGKILINGKGAERIATTIEKFLTSSKRTCIPEKQ